MSRNDPVVYSLVDNGQVRERADQVQKYHRNLATRCLAMLTGVFRSSGIKGCVTAAWARDLKYPASHVLLRHPVTSCLRCPPFSFFDWDLKHFRTKVRTSQLYYNKTKSLFFILESHKALVPSSSSKEM